MPKPQVECCLSPALSSLYDLENSTVVVNDIFRATSCFVSGIGSGVSSIRVVPTVEECEAWGNKGYVTAGERNGVKVAGFELGNSPFDYQQPHLQGQKVCATTTNGAQAMHIAKISDRVLIGAFLNLTAITELLLAEGKPVVVLCSGWKKRFCLEDTLFAGALVSRLSGHFEVTDDAATGAMRLYDQAAHDLEGALAEAAHLKRLKNLSSGGDIPYCLKLDEFEVVPALKDGEVKG